MKEIKEITPLLRKFPWKRLVTADTNIEPIADSTRYEIPNKEPDGLFVQYYGNAELYNMSCEGAHIINTNMYSARPQWEPYNREITETDSEGNTKKRIVKDYRIVGYDEIETVRSGLGEMIIKQKASHLGKNGIETADESGKDHEAYDNWRAWKDISGIDSAWVEMLYHACKTGDVAAYIYMRGNTIEYNLFSYMRGDILYPQKDNDGDFMLVREYQLNGKRAVDVYMKDYIDTYVQVDLSNDKNKDDNLDNWWSKVRGWIKNLNVKKTDDGWTRISRKENQLNECQVVYLRLEEPPLVDAIENINAIERGQSYVSDKVKSVAFSKLLLKAVKIKSVPALNSGEEVIAIDGTADDLKASTAEYLNPPDISNIATIDSKNKIDAVMQSTMSIDLQPEILKSGADSSQTLKLLLRRELQWCHVVWPQVRPVAVRIVEILKGLVGKLEGDIQRYGNLRISVWNTPWLPQDEDALADRVTKMLYAGIISKENARHELNLQYTDDKKIVDQEQEDELYRKAFIPKKAEADAQKEFGVTTATDIIVDSTDIETDNPYLQAVKPGVDNRADRRDIAVE